MPTASVFAIAALIAFVLSMQPSGYRAEYKSPENLAAAPERVSSRGEEKANELIVQLAQLINDSATLIGTHFDGTSEIHEYQLDRSKFDPEPLTSLAGRLHALLKSGVPDYDAFIASAYFNAQIFALSVYIVNGIRLGGKIEANVGQVKELWADPLVSGWLAASKFSAAYDALLAELDTMTLNYKPGSPVADLKREYDSSREKLNYLGQRADTYRMSDMRAYNSLVPIYNRQLEKVKRLGERLAFQSTAEDDLDLAFNRCLDPAILMSKFDKIDLTQTGSKRSSGSPETPIP